MLLLLLKSRQWDVCTERSCSAKESVWRFPQFVLPRKFKLGGMPLVPTTKMADAHKYSVSGNHWPGKPRDLLKNYVPRFLESIPRHVFSINTSSSNTLSLFPNFYCSANTLSQVWLSYSPTDVQSHKMDKPRKHSFLQNTLTMRLFPASETPTVSNHRKKWTFKNM